ncbi:acyl-CoA N-acyltransferase [Nemania sp. FL0031]|nr:acyl-CoA N-acyltransferase [Nemania sp. FL0031]
MVLKLQDIDESKDFPAIARCMFESYEEPNQPLIQIWFPIHGGPDAREDSIQEATDRLKRWNDEDPTSHWHKIVDDKTGKIAGGALWSIYDSNPFANHKPPQAPWFPDDGSRKYAEQALMTHVTPRSRYACRPHIYLFIIFTHPDYRRQGVGKQVMDWGNNKADELGLELFLDATAMGRPLYEANGFIRIQENPIHPQMENPDEKWRELEKKVGEFSLCLMWRPVGGIYEEGKTIKPWEKE